MKTRKNNCFSLQDTVRFGVIILIAIDVLALAIEGARSSQDYPIVSKQVRPKPRETRGFTPKSISTAIGFGKRHNGPFQSSKLGRHDTMMFLPLKDVPQRFPIEWFVQFLKMNPALARRVGKNLLSDEEYTRPSGTQRYKSNKSDLTYYFDELE